MQINFVYWILIVRSKSFYLHEFAAVEQKIFVGAKWDRKDKFPMHL